MPLLSHRTVNSYNSNVASQLKPGKGNNVTAQLELT
jgi:hypothetical protein